MPDNSTRIDIFDQSYQIRGGADPTYVAELAAYVDRKMREVTEKLPVYSISKVAILASLHIADELFKERANQSRVGTDVNGRAAALARRLDEVLAEVSRSA